MALKYRWANLTDLDQLVKSRVEILRAVNHLKDTEDLPTAAIRAYYQAALPAGRHAAILTFDGDRLVAAGGVSFFEVMPTYHNPSGKKAYLMNVYTDPAYRRQGIARSVVRRLVAAAREAGVMSVSLEATELGRPLYESLGFVSMECEMELPEEAVRCWQVETE